MSVERANADDLQSLREENQKLKEQLQSLGDEIDRISRVRQQGRTKKKGKKYGDAESNLHMSPELRAAFKHNEDLRRERTKLTMDIQHSDTARRIQETKNQLHAINNRIEQLNSEIKSQKNINKSRQQVVDVAKADADELRYLREAHRQELNDFREEWRQLDEERKHLERQAVAAQVKMHLITEKLKLGINGDDYEELKNTVADQEAEIESLKTSWARQTMDVNADAKKEARELARDRQEKSVLQARIGELKKLLKDRERELKLSYTAGRCRS